ncbi:hypothetical protein SUNI508_00248 [Seiridium unicorne]|uniref:Aquaglyceroporin n=1 Tax=Seiridium unicorne TaxID=138068 RepID=A0ABR2VIW3_9PEZI
MSSHRDDGLQTGSDAARTPSVRQQHNTRPTANLHRGQNFGSSVRGAYTAGRSDLDNQSLHTIPETPRAERLGWIDEEYIDQNPWHFQAKNKPVFSLGGPLPRLVRGPRKPKHNKDRPLDELAERGELETDRSEAELVRSQESRNNVNEATHTASGTAHNDKRNAAGQPVFDYVPGEAGTRNHPDTDTTSPEFKIDGEPLGKREDDRMRDEDRDPNEFRNWWARIRAKHPEPLAEFLATGVAIFLGLAGSLSVCLSQGQSEPYGSYETSCWAWGFAWMFGVYLGGGVSGAHMNPAISISLSLFRGFPWRQCAIYVVVQFIAAIVAGALAYGCFADTIHYVDPSLENASKAFLSTPQSWVTPGNAFLNQSVGSAIMMIVVFALGDDQNNPPGAGMHAFVLGLLVATLKMTLGFNIGSALNPASDFGPRLIAYAIGLITCKVVETLQLGQYMEVGYSEIYNIIVKMKRKHRSPEVIHELTELVEFKIVDLIYDGTKRKRASLFRVDVRAANGRTRTKSRRPPRERHLCFEDGKRALFKTQSQRARPNGRFWPKFPRARANEDDYRREVAVNAELGRITAVETPEAARDTLFSDDRDTSTLRWPRCYETIRVRPTPTPNE